MKYIAIFLMSILMYIWWIIHCLFYPFAIVLNFLWDFSFLKWGEYSTKKEWRYIAYHGYYEHVPTKGPIDTLKYYRKSLKNIIF